MRLLLAAPVPHIALENPVSAISSRIRKPDQVIHPWQFGHGEVKATCLWLKNLPKLTPTRIVEGREARVHKMPPGPDRWKERSRTLPGIAQAFADQWTRATRPNRPEMSRKEDTEGTLVPGVPTMSAQLGGCPAPRAGQAPNREASRACCSDAPEGRPNND